MLSPITVTSNFGIPELFQYEESAGLQKKGNESVKKLKKELIAAAENPETCQIVSEIFEEYASSHQEILQNSPRLRKLKSTIKKIVPINTDTNEYDPRKRSRIDSVSDTVVEALTATLSERSSKDLSLTLPLEQEILSAHSSEHIEVKLNVKDQEIYRRIHSEHIPLKMLGLSVDELTVFFHNNAKRIEYFDASGYDGTTFLEWLKMCPNLTHIILKQSNINDSLAGSLVEIICNKLRLCSLNVSENRIGPAGARSISRLKKLLELDISQNKIGPQGAESIKELQNLEMLNIGWNLIGPMGAMWVSFLQSKLKILNIEGNHIVIEPIIVNSIGEFVVIDGTLYLSKMTQLEALYMRHNYIGDTGTKSIRKLTNLRTLDVGACGIGDMGILYLSGLTSLHSLNIEYNDFSSEGAPFLLLLRNLQTLHMRGNNIRTKGANMLFGDDIGDGIANEENSLNKLQTLDMSENQINDASNLTFLHQKNLQTIDINGNKLPATEVEKLRSRLEPRISVICQNGTMI